MIEKEEMPPLFLSGYKKSRIYVFYATVYGFSLAFDWPILYTYDSYMYFLTMFAGYVQQNRCFLEYHCQCIL